MELTEWSKRYGHGAYQRLHHGSLVSLKTVYKAAKYGEPVAYEVAEKLSAAVAKIEQQSKRKIGRVSIDEIRFPRGKTVNLEDGRRAARSSAA